VSIVSNHGGICDTVPAMDEYDVASQINKLLPGGEITFTRADLGDIRPRHGFTREDAVMEVVRDAAHEVTCESDHVTGWTTFRRLVTPLPANLHSYVTPDRRDFFKLRSDGLYETPRR